MREMKRNILFIALFLFSLSSWGQKKEIEDYRIPKNIEQAFRLLNKLMTEREKFLVRTLPEDSLYYNDEIGHQTNIDYWFNEKSRLTKYFNKIGLDAFGRQYSHYETLLVSYHRYLNNKEIDIASQIENYNNQWQRESEEYQQRQDSIQRLFQLNKMIISSLNSFIAENNRLVKGVINTDTTHYYISKDGLPLNFPYSSLKNVTFISLDNLDGLPNSFKRKLNKGVRVLFVYVRLSDNQFVITVFNNSVRRIKKNRINITEGFHRGIFTYEYSCENQQWILIETKYGGI